MTKVKICGISEVSHAKAAVEFGVDAVGFVFAPSKRQVTINQVKAITNEIPSNVKKIGVFVNASKHELEHAAREANLDFVQLHGDESPEFCHSLDIPYIKAIRVSHAKDLALIKSYPNASYILLDSSRGPYRGGNGESFDWSLLKESQINRNRIILAGGLTIENVQTAINMTGAGFVDVSSGVETDGIKDVRKIKTFIQKVKERSTCHTHNQT